jgi:MATE family multidrug resistance protein
MEQIGLCKLEQGRRTGPLPAQRIDARGQARVDARAVFALALPLMGSSAVQIVLNLTDIWFVGRLSTQALAAVGSVQWLVLFVVYLLGGAATAVQTLVAQAEGAREHRRAAQAAWIGLWATLIAVPLFLAAGAAGDFVLRPVGIDPRIAVQAGEFWLPRVGGAFFGAALWGMFGFFNGVGRSRTTLAVTCVVAVANVCLNQIFIFDLGLGIAGSGWASTVAQCLGLMVAMGLFLSRRYRRQYDSHRAWRVQLPLILRQLSLGFPMGLSAAADLLGFAIFQIMQVRLGTVGGAATQVVMVLTSISYLPGFGLASAATTLVGQSIGAGDARWAGRVGDRVILLSGLYMLGGGLVLASTGPWVLPLFTQSHDALSRDMVGLASQLLWVAACYQFFDGIAMGSGMSLRGAGDVVVAAALVLPLSLLLFLPLAHMLTFAPGQGWVHCLPQWGWGAVGGWVAVVIYLMVLAGALNLRWRSGAWRSITLDRS